MTRTFEYETKHPILQKHINILEKLDCDRTMCVCYNDEKNAFYIIECCDEWYCHILTKENCIALSNLFRDIAEVIGE